MDFTGYAGTKDAPAEFDELAIWRRRMDNFELPFFLGGYEADFSNINPEQMKVGMKTNFLNYFLRLREALIKAQVCQSYRNKTLRFFFGET